MKFGTMLKDVLESFFKHPATQAYPVEKVIPSDRYRGKLVYNPAACTGCCLCSKD
jgi:formate hydrogenlyase subunit 6/NADH:ubiquinone oxidoreductase subunit I